MMMTVRRLLLPLVYLVACVGISGGGEGGGFHTLVSASTLCTFDGVDYSTINAGSALRKQVGEYIYFVSPCVDRLLEISGGAVDCGAAAACQVGATNPGSWTLAHLSSTPVFSRVSSTSVKSVQTGSGHDCGPLRITTFLYICAGYTTISFIAEPTPCVYTITITTPLACPSPATAWCLFQGMDFSLVGASTNSQPLTVLTGTSNLGVVFQVSLCTDRINVLERNSSLDGVALCRYVTNGSACVPLMQATSSISWTGQTDTAFTAVTTAYNVGGCSSWMTTMSFYCDNATSVVDVGESSCSSVLTILTPIACSIVTPLSSSSAPPLRLSTSAPTPRLSSSSAPPLRLSTSAPTPRLSSSAAPRLRLSSSGGGSAPVEASGGPSTSTLVMIVAGACVGAVVTVFVILSCRRRLGSRSPSTAASAGAGASSSDSTFHYRLHVDSMERSAPPAAMELHSYAYEPHASA